MNASTIAKTLKAKGQPMTLTRIGAGVFDPITGGMTGGVVETFGPIYGRRGSFSNPASGMNAGTLILGGDRLFLMAADVTQIVPTDTITDATGNIWTAIAVNPIDLADAVGTAALYEVHVRK